MKRQILTVALLLTAAIGLAFTARIQAQRQAPVNKATSSATLKAAPPDYTLSGPYAHKNLTIFLVHSQDQMAGPPPLTLQEAMRQKKVIVRETGDVNELTIENRSQQAVFVQAGDIVKGGQQDRVLALDLIVPPRSGRIPIEAFCVEQSRWSQRGAEAVAAFSASNNMLASKDLKLAAKAKRSQSEVWDNVSAAQMKLAHNVAVSRGVAAGAGRGGNQGGGGYIASGGLTDSAGVPAVPAQAAPAPIQHSVTIAQRQTRSLAGEIVNGDAQLAMVTSAASPSSLQLTLENKYVKDTTNGYIKQLSSVIAGKRDVIGYVFAINGQINCADVYSSHGLFKKLWPKLLEASAVEALAEYQAEGKFAAVTADGVQAFLQEAATGNAETKRVPRRTTLVKHETARSLFFETRDRQRRDVWLHRNYLAK